MRVCVCVRARGRETQRSAGRFRRGHRAQLETSGTIPSGYNGPLVPRIVRRQHYTPVDPMMTCVHSNSSTCVGIYAQGVPFESSKVDDIAGRGLYQHIA